MAFSMVLDKRPIDSEGERLDSELLLHSEPFFNTQNYRQNPR